MRGLAETKLMLGTAEGAVVRLGPLGPSLALCEGIETGLAVRQLAPGWTVWCALSAGNLARVAIPSEVRRLVVVADGDRKGDARTLGIRRVGLRAAERAVAGLEGLGIAASIVVPTPNDDLNDILCHDPELAREFAGFMAGARWRAEEGSRAA